jgi:hypothetical protein
LLSHSSADEDNMKGSLILLIFLTFSAWSASGVKGKVTSPKGCSKLAMVWVSLDENDYKDRLLLMHSEVPVGGSFQFYLKPGDYQVRASDDKGCEFLQKIKVKNLVSNIQINMVKK